MGVYTYTNARQNLAQLLDEANNKVDVYIRRKNGQLFQVKAVEDEKSGLDVPGVNVNISTEELVKLIRKGREERP